MWTWRQRLWSYESVWLIVNSKVHQTTTLNILSKKNASLFKSQKAKPRQHWRKPHCGLVEAAMNHMGDCWLGHVAPTEPKMRHIWQLPTTEMLTLWLEHAFDHSWTWSKKNTQVMLQGVGWKRSRWNISFHRRQSPCPASCEWWLPHRGKRWGPRKGRSLLASV